MHKEQIIETKTFNDKYELHSYNNEPSIEKKLNDQLIQRSYHCDDKLFHKTKFASVKAYFSQKKSTTLCKICFCDNKKYIEIDFSHNGNISVYSFKTSNKQISFEFNPRVMLPNDMQTREYRNYCFTDIKGINIYFYRRDCAFSYDLEINGGYFNYEETQVSKSEWYLYKYQIELLISENKPIPIKYNHTLEHYIDTMGHWRTRNQITGTSLDIENILKEI